MVSEISQLQKTNTTWFQLWEKSKVVKLIEVESGKLVAWLEERKSGETSVNEYKVSLMQDEWILEICCTKLCQ